MRVRHTLICFFFLSLQDGNTGLADAQTIVYSGIEGGNVTVQCSSSSSRSRKFFCKERCQQEDILIETTDVRAQSGRYSINRGLRGDLFVTITQLTKSDSGLYRCGSEDSLEWIEIIVVDALLDPVRRTSLYTRPGGNIVVECFFTVFTNRKYFCKEECNENMLVETTGLTARRGKYSIRYIQGFERGGFLYVTITQLTQSDSGRYRCGLGRTSERLNQRFEVIVTDASTTPAFSTSLPAASTPTTQSLSSQTDQQQTEKTDVCLIVGLTLAVMIVLLLLVVVIYCRKRSSKPKEPPMETEYASVTETTRVYEDIREHRQSRTAPVEISPVYAQAKFTKQKKVETPDDYCSVTAAGSQNTAKDDFSKLTYSEVKFSNRSVGTSNRALHGDDDQVVYSVPRVEASSDEHDAPVYSTFN